MELIRPRQPKQVSACLQCRGPCPAEANEYNNAALRVACTYRWAWLQVVEFYKAWDQYGALSNFSPHPIEMPEVLALDRTPDDLPLRRWQTVEHYYQAQKFAGRSLIWRAACRDLGCHTARSELTEVHMQV